MGVEEVGLEGVVVVVVEGGFEVGDSIASTEAEGGDVVSLGGVVFFVESAEPHSLVFLVNLSTPSAVGLRDNSFETGRWKFTGFCFRRSRRR